MSAIFLVEEERNKACSDGYFKSMRQMQELFSDIPEAISNTELIARRCTFLLGESKPLLPKFYPTKKQVFILV